MKSTSTKENQISVQVERKPHCLVTLQVEVEPELVQQEYERAIKELNKEVSLPGFRKGKAPRDYMINHFKSHIDRRWQDNLADVVFQLALRQTAIYPLDRNTRVNCDWKKCSLDKEKALCVFEYETLPELPSIEWNELAVDVPSKACVCEQEIQKELEELSKRHSHWQNVEHDTPQEGEWIEIEVLDANGSSIYIGKRFEYTPLTMPKDLYEAVHGVKIGESKAAKLKRPGSDEIVDASLNLVKILKRIPAAIDDNIAKQLGLQDLSALKERIEKNLSETSQYDYRNSCFEAIQKALSEKYKFEVPQSTLGYEQRMQENALLSESNKSEEDMSEEEKQMLKVQAKERAEAAIRQTFILHKIASQVGIRIEDREVHELMRPFLHELEKEKDQQRLRQRFQTLYGRCRMHLVAEKALEHVAKSRGWL